MHLTASSKQPYSFQLRLEKWLDYAGTTFLILMPLLIFMGIAACDVAIVGIAVLFVARSIVTHNFSWLNMLWVRCGFVLWLFFCVTSFYAISSTKASLHQAIPFVRFVIFAAALQTWLLAQEKNRRYLLRALTVTVLVIAFNTAQSFVTGLTLLGQNSIAFHASTHHFYWAWEHGFGRLLGINGKQNPGILLSWSCFPVVTYLLSKVNNAERFSMRLLPFFGVLMIAVGILLTGERMALLEFCFGMALLFILTPLFRKTLFISFSVIAVVGLAILLLDKGIWMRNVTHIITATRHFSGSVYDDIFRAAFAMFKDHPIFGIGLKQYHDASLMPPYVHFYAVNTHPQNMYLEFLIGGGIIGFGLLIAIMVSWLRSFWRNRVAIRHSVMGMGVLIAFVLRSWPIASTTSFFFAWGGITFWWMAAWLLALSRKAESGRCGTS